MDASPSVALWHVHHGTTHYHCVIEQVGEDCFELRLSRGKKLVFSQSGDDAAPLLALADVLRLDIDQPKRRALH